MVKKLLSTKNKNVPKKGLRSIIIILLCMFAVYNFVLVRNTFIAAQDKKKTEQKTTKTKKSQTPQGGQSHLAEAGKFEIGEDPTVWVLIFLFNVAVAVSIERAFYLYRNKGRNAELINMLTHELSENSDDCAELIEKASDKKFGTEGRIAAKTLQGWNFGDKTMNEFAKAALEAEQRHLDKRLVVLSTLGNNTPFIGLLGTVLGIMKAFRDLAMVGDAGPAVVMKGISEALIATAFGLGVAIPCVMAYNFFSKRVKAKISNAVEIVNILTGIRSAFEIEGQAGVKKIADSNDQQSPDDDNKIASTDLATESV